MSESNYGQRSCRVFTDQRVHAQTGQNHVSDGTHQSMIRHYFSEFHRRYWIIDYTSTQSYDLLVSRILALVIWLYVLILESLADGNIMQPSMTVLNFLFASLYSLKDISTIIYAAGAAVYGISLEMYVLLPWIILNCMLAINSCGMNHRETIATIIYIFKALALFAGTELGYQNFRRFTFRQSYQLHYQTASRAILRQSIYLIVTIVFLVSPGLRSVYSAVHFKCPYLNEINNESYCNLIDIERPVSEGHPTCVADYTVLITGMEQLRTIRDIAVFSIAFYSIYNKGFLDITGATTIIHRMMLLLFFAMSCSVLVVNTDPIRFGPRKFYFNVIEISLFLVLMILLIVSLRKKNERRKFVIMQENPTT